MTIIIAVAVILLLLAAIAMAARSKNGRVGDQRKSDSDEYQTNPALFSPADRSFLGVMDGVVPESVTCMGKVRLGDVFVTRKGLSKSDGTRARNKINQKHVDFLLVQTSNFGPLVGIELDDRSHEGASAKEPGRLRRRRVSVSWPP